MLEFASPRQRVNFEGSADRIITIASDNFKVKPGDIAISKIRSGAAKRMTRIQYAVPASAQTANQ